MYTFDQICETSKDREGKQKGTFSFVADTFNLLDLRHVQSAYIQSMFKSLPYHVVVVHFPAVQSRWDWRRSCRGRGSQLK